jgi:hypothetical protein
MHSPWGGSSVVLVSAVVTESALVLVSSGVVAAVDDEVSAVLLVSADAVPEPEVASPHATSNARIDAAARGLVDRTTAG